MKNKKILPAFLAGVTAMSAVLCSCSGAGSGASTGASSGASSAGNTSQSLTSAPAAAAGTDAPDIVCTTFPCYDWVMNILGEKASSANVTYLLGSGTDMHNYQPTAEDIIKISTCDMFVYVGGESDEWARDAIADAVNKDMKTVDLLASIGSSAVEEEHKEGMQEHDHGGDHDEDHDHEEETEYDEHVWLSLDNASLLCGKICDALCEISASDADIFRRNLDSYRAELDALDKQFSGLFAGKKQKTLVFADRFPFRYFTEEYGLDYYAAFSGCSAESEASFGTIVFLASKIDELGVRTVYTIEGSDGSVARTVINSTQAKSAETAVLNSIQSVTSAQAEAGVSYLSLMRDNLDVLEKTMD